MILQILNPELGFSSFLDSSINKHNPGINDPLLLNSAPYIQILSNLAHSPTMNQSVNSIKKPLGGLIQRVKILSTPSPDDFSISFEKTLSQLLLMYCNEMMMFNKIRVNFFKQKSNSPTFNETIIFSLSEIIENLKEFITESHPMFQYFSNLFYYFTDCPNAFLSTSYTKVFDEKSDKSLSDYSSVNRSSLFRSSPLSNGFNDRDVDFDMSDQHLSKRRKTNP